MKIIFTPLLFVLGYIAIHSQITTNSDAKMFVSAKTLVYSTGNITINSDASTITNNGNVRIKTGTYVNNSTTNVQTADAGFMKLTYTAADTSTNQTENYGQLIIDGTTAAIGKIKMERGILASTNYAYFSSPFAGYTFDELASDIGSTYTTFVAVCPTSKLKERGKNSAGRAWCSSYGSVPIFVWNNDQSRFDPDDGVSTNKTFTPGKFYDLRKSIYTGTDWTSTFTFNGVPFVGGAVASTAYAFSPRTAIMGSGMSNVYNVAFYTYASDPFVTTLEGSFDAKTTNETLAAAGFGDYILEFTNPYTSNLDLSALTSSYTNVYGVASYGAITTGATKNSRFTSDFLAATVTNNVLVGNLTLGIIPPMTNFIIKGITSGSALNLHTSDYQTFNTSNYVIPTSGLATNNTSKSVATNNRMASSSKNVSSSTSNIYQISLKLADKSTNEVYNDTYVASNSEFETGTLHKNEVYSYDTGDGKTRIYTLPEAKTGGIDPASEDIKLYINVMNSNSEKVAIPVGIDVSGKDGSTFVITSQLAENGKYLAKEKINFNDSNAEFYFHDKKLGKSILIDSNFKYEFTQTESTKDRFEIFWGKTSTDSGSIGEEIGTSEDTQALDDLTFVYKSDDDYKVRFNKNWKNAQVSVFTIAGQLISSKKNINTGTDYLLPIKNVSSSMFVIKVINENGETVVKKIVK